MCWGVGEVLHGLMLYLGNVSLIQASSSSPLDCPDQPVCFHGLEPMAHLGGNDPHLFGFSLDLSSDLPPSGSGLTCVSHSDPQLLASCYSQVPDLVKGLTSPSPSMTPGNHPCILPLPLHCWEQVCLPCI